MSLGGTFAKASGIKLPNMSSYPGGIASTVLSVSPYTSGQFNPQGKANPPAQTDVTSSGGGGYATPADQSAIAQQQKINAANSQFSDYLNNDATLGGQLQQLASQRTNHLNNFLTNAQQAEIVFGRGLDSSMLPKFKDPTSSNDLQFTDASGNPMNLATALADPTVTKAANSNPYSAVASIAQQLTGANSAAVNNEAARGMLFSGAYGQHMNENAQAADSANYNALQSFLSALNSGYSDYSNSLGSIEGEQSKDVNDALARIVALIQAGYYKLGGDTQKPGGGGGGSDDGGPGDKGAAPFAPSPDVTVPAEGYNSVQGQAGNIFTPVHTGSNKPSLEPKPMAANYGVSSPSPLTTLHNVLSGYSQYSKANLH